MVGELLGLFHVMCGVEDGHPLRVQFLDIVQDVSPALRVDSHGWLIHDDDRRFVHQGCPDIDAALHSSGKLVHPVLLPFHQPDDLQDFIDSFGKVLSCQTVHPAPEGEIFPGRQIPVQGNILGNHTDHGLDRLRLLHDRVPHHAGVSCSGLQQTGEH